MEEIEKVTDIESYLKIIKLMQKEWERQKLDQILEELKELLGTEDVSDYLEEVKDQLFVDSKKYLRKSYSFLKKVKFELSTDSINNQKNKELLKVRKELKKIVNRLLNESLNESFYYLNDNEISHYLEDYVLHELKKFDYLFENGINPIEILIKRIKTKIIIEPKKKELMKIIDEETIKLTQELRWSTQKEILLSTINEQIENNESTDYFSEILKLLLEIIKGKENLSLKDFDNLVVLIESSKNMYFYRGQSESRKAEKEGAKYFSIVPSLMHIPDVQRNEYAVFQDILRLDTNAFNDQKNYLDIHKEMQHYAEISRVIDITTQALTGLFFAVGELTKTPSKDPCVFMFSVAKDMVKRPESDGTQIKLALSTIKDDQRNHLKDAIFSYKGGIKNLSTFNKEESVKKLCYAVRKNDGVLEKIEVPEDIEDIEFVLPNMNNKRIIAQQGAFIAVGLLNDKKEVYEKIEPHLRLPGTEELDLSSMAKENYMMITIDKDKAYQIKLDLERIGITKAVMYPDIQKIGQYYKRDYYNR